MKMKLTIFSKLLLCFFIAICLLSIIFISVSSSLNRSFVNNINAQVGISLENNTHNFLIGHSRTTLNYLEEAIVDKIYFSDSDAIHNEIAKFTNDPNLDAIAVWDAKNNLLAANSKQIIDTQSELYQVIKNGLKHSSEMVTEFNDNVIVARKIYIYDQLLGIVIVSANHAFYKSEIQKSLDTVRNLSDEFVHDYLKRLTIIIIFSTLVFVLFSSGIISRITQPLRQLKTDMNRFGNDTQNPHSITQRGNDEIGQLAKSFYQMSLKVRKREAQISQLAQTDTLTQLNNRTSLIKQIAKLIRSEDYKSLMCVYLDLDNFKDINDTFGHEEGDRVIIELAQRLQKLTLNSHGDEAIGRCISNNLFLSRLGGDEFVLLFHFDQETPYSDALGDALAKQVLRIFDKNLLDYNTSSSIGISVYPKDGSTVEDLLKASDIAMYHAKSLGRNQYQFFSQEMSTALMRAREIEQALQSVLDNNLLEQFHIVYQPQYRLSKNTFVGMEALIRWHHPHYGYLSPAEFIPIAERRGLIDRFTFLTLDLLIDDMLRLKSRTTTEFTVSWNLSTIVLLQPDIADTLVEKLSSKGFNSKMLCIEITETALISDLSLAKYNIEQLRNRGFKIWLDDFGTGYSSLSMLSDIQIDGLKIDRSFVDKITPTHAKNSNVQNSNDKNQVSQLANYQISNDLASNNNNAVIDAFIKLADTLQLDVVAEGIETQAQLDYLNQLSCTYGQGYYLGKPIPYHEVLLLDEMKN